MNKNPHKEIITRTRLTLAKKLEITEKLERGVPSSVIMREYSIGKTQFYQIKADKKYIQNYAAQSDGMADVKNRLLGKKSMKKPFHPDLEDALYAWYKDKINQGIPVRKVEIRSMGLHIASELNIPNFHASNGWISRFCDRNDIGYEEYKVPSSSSTDECDESSNEVFVKTELQEDCELKSNEKEYQVFQSNCWNSSNILGKESLHGVPIIKSEDNIEELHDQPEENFSSDMWMDTGSFDKNENHSDFSISKNKTNMENEIDCFVKYMTIQLRNLPEHSALKSMSHIQSYMMNQRFLYSENLPNNSHS